MLYSFLLAYLYFFVSNFFLLVNIIVTAYTTEFSVFAGALKLPDSLMPHLLAYLLKTHNLSIFTLVNSI